MKFNLYFAGSQHKEIEGYLKQKEGARLFSFADKNGIKGADDWAETSPNSNLFMDSGAFSVFHNGAKIDIDLYTEYINNHPHLTVFAQLDDIPYPTLNSETAKNSSEGSWEKYLYLMNLVKDEYKDKVIPIYHFGEPKEALERMLNTEVDGRLAPYIGVGGRHGVSTREHYIYFDNIFDIIKKSKNPNVKVHAFGMTVLKLLEYFPFYSADSTSWLKLAVYGKILFGNGSLILSNKAKGRTKTNMKGFHYLPVQVQKELSLQIEKTGYSVEELSENYLSRLKYNIDFSLNWANNYQYTPLSSSKRKTIL